MIHYKVATQFYCDPINPDIPLVYAYGFNVNRTRNAYERAARKRWPKCTNKITHLAAKGELQLGKNVIVPINDYVCVVHVVGLDSVKNGSGKLTPYDYEAMESCFASLRHDIISQWLMYTVTDGLDFELHIPRIGGYIRGYEVSWIPIKVWLNEQFSDINVVVIDDTHDQSVRCGIYN